MKLQASIFGACAAACLAGTADAQQTFGPWIHDPTVPFLSLYVDDNGSDANSGASPSSPFLTLQHAVNQADFWMSVFWPFGYQTAITINVMPGIYNLQDVVHLPAFGVSIEPYWELPAGSVVIRGPLGLTFLDVDHLVGPLSAVTIGLPANLPPTIVRGLKLEGTVDPLGPTGIGIHIDPTRNLSADLVVDRPIEVQVNQCTLSQFSRGIQIRNSGRLEWEYQNLIINSGIGSCGVGIDVENWWFESDLIRSNKVIGAMTGMSFNGSVAKDGRLHPRILSNTVTNTSFLVGMVLNDCSARIVNNTLGYVYGPSGGGPIASQIRIVTDAGGSGAESIVIANNLLFTPQQLLLTSNPPEIRIVGPAAFAGTLVLESNDFDSGGLLIQSTPAIVPSSSNIGIANAQFVAAPGDLHLTSASPSITNLGNQSFVLPGPAGSASSITFPNGQSLPANCALDFDLDARTHMPRAVFVDVLHRGSDQFIESGMRLRTATSGPNPLAIADAFGNLPVDASGNSQVDLLLDLPVGSAFSIVLCATLPMGPEMQHIAISPFGSLAIDPTPPNGVTVLSGMITVNPQPLNLSLASLVPVPSTEAEVYLQAVVALPSGEITFSNRIRLDIDGL